MASSTSTASALAKLNKTTIRLYRLLIRECNVLGTSTEEPIFLQRPLNPKYWGVARQHAIRRNCSSTEILNFLDGYLENENAAVSEEMSVSPSLESFFVTVNTLKQTIRSTFRATPVPETKPDILKLHRRAIDSIRLLKNQISLQRTTSVCYDPKHRIRVIATSISLGRGEASATKNHTSKVKKYFFTYRIRVENCNDSNQENAVQLLGRSWFITPDDGGETTFVHSPTTGAVGHMPVIQPGQVFEYMSGTDLEATTGSMSGLFHMAVVPKETKSKLVDGDHNLVRESFSDDKLFQVEVAPFALIATS